MPKPQIDEATQEQIRQLVAEGKSFRAVARELEISDSTVRKYVEQFGIEVFQSAADRKDPFQTMGRRLARQQEELKQLRAHTKAVNERGWGYDAFIDQLRDLYSVEAIQPLAYYPRQIKQHKPIKPILDAVDKDHMEMAVLNLSDWHLTENVRYEDSNLVNRYNTIIAANRLFNVIIKAKRIIEMHRAMYRIDKLVIPILGDLISGSIHEEFISTNDATDQVAQIIGMRLLEMALLELSTLGIPIEVHAVVGNHPRTTKKVPTKNLAHTNLEWVVYEAVSHLFNDVYKHLDVKMNAYTSQWKDIDIFGHRNVIEHGIGWANNKEEDFESAIRDVMDDSIFRDATGLQGTSFEQVIIGDRHKPKFLERTVVNGSLIGQNELGQQWRLKPIRAQQLMFGVSRSHFRTWQYNLDVTGQKDDKPSNPFSDFVTAYLKRHGNTIL